LEEENPQDGAKELSSGENNKKHLINKSCLLETLKKPENHY
jgi:hypothetical protein